MKLLRAITLLATAVLLLSAAPASAGTPAPDYRGDPNSVHAIFYYGDDFASFSQIEWDTALFETGDSIYPLNQEPARASDDGTDTTIILPNFIDPLPLKLMRITMSFFNAVPGNLLALDLIAHDPEPATSWNVVGGSGFIGSTSHWIDIEIRPNPDWEEIIIFGVPGTNLVPGNLYRIEIDTVSIPEPATLSLLAIGGLLALLRRKRVG